MVDSLTAAGAAAEATPAIGTADSDGTVKLEGSSAGSSSTGSTAPRVKRAARVCRRFSSSGSLTAMVTVRSLPAAADALPAAAVVAELDDE